MPSPPRLSEIAARCGLSKASVSLALRESPKIPAETRRRVLEAAQALGYEANRNVSRLMSEIRTGAGGHFRDTLAYIVDRRVLRGYNLWPGQIESGVRRRAAAIGYGVDRFVMSPGATEERRLGRMLSSRGIRGVVVSPFATVRRGLALPWPELAVVAIGYSLARPEPHRVARDMVHTTRLVLEDLHSRGFRRIGFVMERSHEARMDYGGMAGFLAYRWRRGARRCVEPLVMDRITGASFGRWRGAERPDVIVTMCPQVHEWLAEEGVSVPRDLAVCDLASKSATSTSSGIYPNYEEIGASAVEQVAALVERGEFGIPAHPKTLLVGGVRVAGTTLGAADGKQTRPEQD